MMSAILPSANAVGYSADVRMHLTVAGHILAIGQLGPDFLLLRTPIDQPPSRARLFVAIDDKTREWDIFLPQGISAASRRVVITKAK